MKIGDLVYGQPGNNESIFVPMKTINRMALGTLSSLLLSAGLTRAAQKLDPLTNSIKGRNLDFGCNLAPASDCTTSPCLYQ